MKPINETPISSDAAYERETVINFCDAEKKASYYTRNRSRMQELRNLAAEYPDDVKLTVDMEDCVEAELPKKWVKLRAPVKMSEERRAIMVEKRLAAIAKAKLEERKAAATQED